MPVLADLPHPAPFQGLVYFVDDAWPGAPAPAGFVISDWDGAWHPIPFATLAGFLLINKGTIADMKTYLSVTTSDVTGLSTALAAKANLVHTHVISDVTGLQTALDGKASVTHTHAISDVTGLTAALAAKENSIAAGTTAQYWRGDKSWQTLDKAAVGLSNVDNTSDINKPISTAVQTALDGKSGNTIGSPTTRTVALSTAYQATTTTKPAYITINLTSIANFSLTGGTTNAADIVMGPTNAVAAGTGTLIGRYANSVTGAIAVGLNMNSQSAQTYTIALPAGWFFAVRQTSGAVTITSVFDQVIG